MSFASFSLEVAMDGYTEDPNRAVTNTLIATATSIKILREEYSSVPHSQQFIAAMIPHSMVESSLSRTIYNQKASKKCNAESKKCLWLEQNDRIRLSRDLLPRIHKLFVIPKKHSLLASTISPSSSSQPQPILIRAVFSTSGYAQHSPADVVLLDVPSSMDPSELLQATNGEGILEEPTLILKLLIISQVHIASTSMNPLHALDIPLCPVCLHRIDPARLALPKPPNPHLCSKFCPPDDCPKQVFLKAWPSPSHCLACQVIHDYQTIGAHIRPVSCDTCALPNTLWVCLTCGFCGCGRYSNKHAETHFRQSGHCYSLELATLRIWDYAAAAATNSSSSSNGTNSAEGEFVHRGDLLECPAGKEQRARALSLQQELAAEETILAAVASVAQSQQQQQQQQQECQQQQQQYLQQYAHSQPYYWGDHNDEKSPKKAIMIGEEYEALLQSALEDQAQHYQGEISRLRAELTAEQVDMDSLTPEEAEIIQKLKDEIAELRDEADKVGRSLLDAQAQEAGYRADSQRLLREQQVAQELLKTIQEETKREQEQGKKQVEELEQQIADLTANLRMRKQFSQNQELTNAQIFGTMTSPDADRNASRKGKLRRLFRK